jgi:poly(3-hydroxybutyrate) depolymerase
MHSTNRTLSLLNRTLGVALVVFVLGVSVSRALAATAADFLSAILPKTGAEPNDLPYRYLVPAGYNANNEYPLIVFLHGSGERGNNNTAQLGNNVNGALQLVSGSNQTNTPCFMIAPQASVNEGWNANTLGQVIRAIQVLETTYSIDLNRIYVTGLSMGGAGTWEIITRYPFFFAAAVPMSGWGAGSYEKITGIPIWAFHAANDGTVGVNGSDNSVSAVRQLGGRVIYTRYATGGHGIWPTAYANPNLFPWMMAQRRNQAMTGAPIVSITSPTPHVVPPPAVPTLNIAGTASMPGGVAQVSWTFTPWVGAAGVDTSTYSLASGTGSWSVNSAPVAGNSALFLAIATGSSWATGTGSATGGGVTTLNDYLWTVPTGANVTPPAIAITSPANAGSITTSATTLNLVGTASAASGKTIKGIRWRSNRGGEGIALGTTAWSIDGIDLQPGENVVTVIVRDSSSITTSTTITVNSTGTGVVIAPSHAIITITVL